MVYFFNSRDFFCVFFFLVRFLFNLGLCLDFPVVWDPQESFREAVLMQMGFNALSEKSISCKERQISFFGLGFQAPMDARFQALY